MNEDELMRVGRVGFEPHERDDDDDDEPLPHSHYKMIICLRYWARQIHYVNIAVTNINKTLLLNMVIFCDFNFREYEIKNIIAIQFS